MSLYFFTTHQIHILQVSIHLFRQVVARCPSVLWMKPRNSPSRPSFTPSARRRGEEAARPEICKGIASILIFERSFVILSSIYGYYSLLVMKLISCFKMLPISLRLQGCLDFEQFTRLCKASLKTQKHQQMPKRHYISLISGCFDHPALVQRPKNGVDPDQVSAECALLLGDPKQLPPRAMWLGSGGAKWTAPNVCWLCTVYVYHSYSYLDIYTILY